MKSRNAKRQSGKVAEKATGRVGAFPYHKAIAAKKREQKSKAASQAKIAH